MALSSKQVAAIAEAAKTAALSKGEKPIENPKAPSTGKVTQGLKPPPKMNEESLKVPKSAKMPQPKFKINSIADIKKARQNLKGDY